MPIASAAAVTDPPSSSIARVLSMMADRLARLPGHSKCAYGHQGFNRAYMTQTLQERMVELMTATGWTVGEIARIAGVTSAAVSQWVGNGSGKQSKSIGNAEAAVRLEKASGFSWMWLSQGRGPKLAPATGMPVQPQSAQTEADQVAHALEVLTKTLLRADEDVRLSVEPLLASMAREPAKAVKKSQLILRLLFTDTVQTIPAENDRPGHTSGDLGILNLGDEEHGERDRAEAKGGSKR